MNGQSPMRCVKRAKHLTIGGPAQVLMIYVIVSSQRRIHDSDELDAM